MLDKAKGIGDASSDRKTGRPKRFNEFGQELAVCKHCGHEILALSRPQDYPFGDGPRDWVHRNPSRNFPTYCVRDTEAEPSDFPENISVEEADRILRENGTSGEAVVNGFIERLLSDRLTLIEAVKAFIRDRGRHDDSHLFNLMVCSRCDEQYAAAEAALDNVLALIDKPADESAKRPINNRRDDGQAS